ncbi:CaiB/BaiF CoA transferase family protein [Paraburkholderia caribensis]|uniref:CaiB/BaiF CoA transferase family protein n=1 Tax=Paraburkholderia caribensis TaxID=75105 RepID=UPI00159247A8|nr:CoA transferase [Paraburkholderia caribensis]
MSSPAAAATQASGALKGIRVIDISRVLGGPLAGQILADHGADVIKVEPPQGDETREWGPPFQGDASAYFLNVNRNKRALALDLSREAGREVLLRLLETADVLIENFKPGTMEKWGLGYEQLSQLFPRLIHASVTGFGKDGPFGGYPGYDLMAQAWTGLVSINGSKASGPLRVGMPVIDMMTGMNAVVGITMSLYERERSGKGQHVDLTLYDTGVSLLHPHAPNWFMSGKVPGLTGNDHPSISPYSLFETKGAPMLVTVGNDRQYERFCEVIGAPELATDPRFRSNARRVENREVLAEAIQARLKLFDGEELARKLMDVGVGGGPVQSVDRVLTHPHTLHRKMVVQLGNYRSTGIPVKLSRTPGNVYSPPPEYNQHAREILAEVQFTPADVDALEARDIVRTVRKRHGD